MYRNGNGLNQAGMGVLPGANLAASLPMMKVEGVQNVYKVCVRDQNVD